MNFACFPAKFEHLSRWRMYIFARHSAVTFPSVGHLTIHRATIPPPPVDIKSVTFTCRDRDLLGAETAALLTGLIPCPYDGCSISNMIIIIDGILSIFFFFFEGLGIVGKC